LRHGGEVSSAAFRADGRLLVTGSRDWKVRIWDVGDAGIVGKPRILRHPAPVTSLALCEDGRALAVGCRSGQVFAWDLTSPSVVAVLPQLGLIFRVSIGEDGRTVLASGTETSARLWRLPRRKPAGISVLEKDILYGMALSPDGTTLATAGEEGTASEGVTLDRRPTPRPQEGDAEAIASRIQAMTGIRYQPAGGFQVLDIAERQQVADQ
jgi:WD40 repeat protein